MAGGVRDADPPVPAAQDRRQRGARAPAGGDGTGRAGRGPAGGGRAGVPDRALARPRACFRRTSASPTCWRPPIPRRAAALLEEAIRADPERAYLAFDRLARALRGVRRSPRASWRCARSSSASDPRDWRARLALARTLRREGRHDEALGLLLRAIEANPQVLLAAPRDLARAARLGAQEPAVDALPGSAERGALLSRPAHLHGLPLPRRRHALALPALPRVEHVRGGAAAPWPPCRADRRRSGVAERAQGRVRRRVARGRPVQRGHGRGGAPSPPRRQAALPPQRAASADRPGASPVRTSASCSASATRQAPASDGASAMREPRQGRRGRRHERRVAAARQPPIPPRPPRASRAAASDRGHGRAVPRRVRRRRRVEQRRDALQVEAARVGDVGGHATCVEAARAAGGSERRPGTRERRSHRRLPAQRAELRGQPVDGGVRRREAAGRVDLEVRERAASRRSASARRSARAPRPRRGRPAACRRRACSSGGQCTTTRRSKRACCPVSTRSAASVTTTVAPPAAKALTPRRPPPRARAGARSRPAVAARRDRRTRSDPARAGRSRPSAPTIAGPEGGHHVGVGGAAGRHHRVRHQVEVEGAEAGGLEPRAHVRLPARDAAREADADHRALPQDRRAASTVFFMSMRDRERADAARAPA